MSDSEISAQEQLAAIIARGARAAGHGESFASGLAELARSFTPPEPAPPPPVDLIVRPLGSDRLEGGRGGAPSSAESLFASALGAVERVALPSSSSSEPPPSASPPSPGARSSVVDSSQAHHRKGRGRRRKKKRRRSRRKHEQSESSKKRLEELRETIFSAHGQVPDVPDIPPLERAVYAVNLLIARDATGKKAREVLSWFPMTQQMVIYGLGYVAAPKVRAGRSSTIGRADVVGGLPETPSELVRALEMIKRDVAPSLWFRRLVAAAWALWSHRAAPTEAARKASRGAIFTVRGFSRAALAWLVPKADGTPWSVSTLFRAHTGPFALLGASARRLGRKRPGEAGAGLFTRWQPPHEAALYKGPWKKNPKTGKKERFALSEHRYDAPMAGRTAKSLARRARGTLREVARALVATMTPWVKLPTPRRRKIPPKPRPQAEPAEAERSSADEQGARAPP